MHSLLQVPVKSAVFGRFCFARAYRDRSETYRQRNINSKHTVHPYHMGHAYCTTTYHQRPNHRNFRRAAVDAGPLSLSQTPFAGTWTESAAVAAAAAEAAEAVSPPQCRGWGRFSRTAASRAAASVSPTHPQTDRHTKPVCWGRGRADSADSGVDWRRWTAVKERRGVPTRGVDCVDC